MDGTASARLPFALSRGLAFVPAFFAFASLPDFDLIVYIFDAENAFRNVFGKTLRLAIIDVAAQYHFAVLHSHRSSNAESAVR